MDLFRKYMPSIHILKGECNSSMKNNCRVFGFFGFGFYLHNILEFFKILQNIMIILSCKKFWTVYAF